MTQRATDQNLNSVLGSRTAITCGVIAGVVVIAVMTRWESALGESAPFNRVLPAIVVTLLFSLLAWRMRAVSASGAIAGALVSFLLYVSAGVGAFAGLVSVFLLTWIGTRLGYARKQRLGTAEGHGGRSAAQVFANLATAALLSVAATLVGSRSGYFRIRDTLILAAVAALAEAAADTVSSECGQAWSDHVRLITTWKRVSPGTDGGISVLGTLAGVIAALVVIGICAAVRLVTAYSVLIAASAAVLGMVFDSLLGATLERRGLIGNNAVNLASTVFAAATAFVLALA